MATATQPWTPQRIKALRESKFMTQAEFAVVLDVWPSTVLAWEHGRSNPRARHKKHMAEMEVSA